MEATGFSKETEGANQLSRRLVTEMAVRAARIVISALMIPVTDDTRSEH